MIRPQDAILWQCRIAQISRKFTCNREPAGPDPSTCPLSVDTSIISATARDITSTTVPSIVPLACRHKCLLNQCLDQAEFAISEWKSYAHVDAANPLVCHRIHSRIDQHAGWGTQTESFFLLSVPHMPGWPTPPPWTTRHMVCQIG